jgi:hypothetical protein
MRLVVDCPEIQNLARFFVFCRAFLCMKEKFGLAASRNNSPAITPKDTIQTDSGQRI